jgi:hypothetical protein
VRVIEKNSTGVGINDLWKEFYVQIPEEENAYSDTSNEETKKF